MTACTTAPSPDFVSDDLCERFTIMWGLWPVLKLCADPSVKTVLDIGCGAGEHTRLLRHFGKQVFTNDWKTQCDYPGDILDIEFDRQFDGVLCSHVLEHQRNVGLFLDKLLSLVKDDGAIGLAVPLHSSRGLVLGHLTIWSSHLLAYNLLRAGLDCSKAQCLEDNECSFYARKVMFDCNALQEKKWNEVNLGSGTAYNETITLPWHDDIEIVEPLMPADSMSANWNMLNNYGWDGSIKLPVPPYSTKDIEILSNKQEEPVRLYYDAIVAKAKTSRAA